NDIKTIPASMCKAQVELFLGGGNSWTAPAFGAPIDNPPSIGFGYGAAWIDQNAPGSNYLSCPLVRDYTTNLNGLADVHLYVRDFSSTLSVGCRVITMSADTIQFFTSQLVE